MPLWTWQETKHTKGAINDTYCTQYRKRRFSIPITIGVALYFYSIGHKPVKKSKKHHK